MNIAIVTPYFSTYIRSNEEGLANTLSNMGHKVTVYTTKEIAPRENVLGKVNNTNVNSSYVIKHSKPILTLPNNPIVTNIDNSIKNNDVVMLQEDYPYICRLAFNKVKDTNAITILSSERNYFPNNIIKRYVLKLQDQISNNTLRNNVNILTAHCNDAKEFMQHELKTKRSICVITPGVDTNLFKPLNPEYKWLTKGEIKLLTIARLHPYKGLDYLIRAMYLLKDDKRLHLYILGNGNEEHNLKHLVQTLGLNNITFLTTSIPQQLIPNLISECDVYVQPSIIEPFGLAVLDAVACGKPVVCNSVGGMKDTVLNNYNGCVVSPANINELANAILKAINNKTYCGNNSRKRAVKHFDWYKIGNVYINEIKKYEQQGIGIVEYHK